MSTTTTTMPPPTLSTTSSTTPTPTSTTHRSRRAPVPLLLEAFPVPPSHIPPTPTTPNNAAFVNPPPTGPPTTPLPPVPGPSRISEHEQLLLLSSAVNRSRRSSKYSATSSASQRESVVSLASSGGHGSVHGHGSSVRSSFASSSGRSPASTSSPLPPPSAYPAVAAAVAAGKRSSTASASSSGGSPSSSVLVPSSPRSRPSISISLSSTSSSPRHQPRTIQRSHRELHPQGEEEEQQLTRMSMSPIPLSDIDDDDAGEHNVPPAVMPSGSPTLARAMFSSSASARHQDRHHQANESISSIDMRDVLGVGHDYEDEDDYDRDADFFPPPVLSPTSMSSWPSRSQNQLPHQHHHPHHQPQVSLADPIDPHGLLLDFAQMQRERQAFVSSSTSPRSKSFDNHPQKSPPSPTSTEMLHRSGSSIGSFSYPSSSKKSPVTVFAPFAPANTTTSTSNEAVVPRLPPASPYAHTYPSVATVLEREEGGVSASVSTVTQLSTSSSVGGVVNNKDGVAPSYSRPPPTTFSSILTGTFEIHSRPTNTAVSTPTVPHTTSSSSSIPTSTITDPISPSTSTVTTTPTSTPSIGTVKDSRMERRAERTRSAGLKKVLDGRSRSRNGRELEERGPEPHGGLPPVPVSSTARPGVGLGIGVSKEREREVLKDLDIAVTKTMQVAKGEAMTLEELGPVKGGAGESGGSAGENVGVVFPRRESLSKSTSSVPGIRPSSSASAVASTRTLSVGTSESSSATPKSTSKQHPPPPPHPEASRTPSPDIDTILNTSTSSRRRSKSKSRVGLGLGIPSTRTRVRSVPGKRHASEGTATGANLRLSVGSSKSSSSWDDRERARGARMGRVRSMDRVSGHGDYEGEYDEELERVLEGEGSEDEDVNGYGGGAQYEDDSDSSLDLHTPLPHLMVRHGLLSPHSKLLPGGASRATTPMAADGRPGSIMSVASNASMMTKSGIMKDERDTPMRRVRHRDGKMLRGGIGLTTGLGWSDSEDEDAPSPLTRRLSSLNLSRRASASSLGHSITSRPSSHHQYSQQGKYRHPLSRSYSSGALVGGARELPEFDEFDEFDDEHDDGEEDHSLKESGEWAQRQRVQSGRSGRSVGTNTVPPTSWQRRTISSSGSRSSYATGTGGDRSSLGTAASGDRTSKASLSSVGSTLSTADASLKTPSRLRTPSGAKDSSGDRHGKGLPTPTKKASQDDVNTTPSSTASTLSIPMPLTPRDIDHSTATASTTKALSEKKSLYDKEKSLPPLPAGGLKKMPSHARIDAGTGAGATKIAFPRARTFSSTSTTAASSSVGAIASPSSAAVRPLQLPRQAGLTRGTTGDRPAVPVPSVLALSSSGSRSSLRAPSSSGYSQGFSTSPTSPSSHWSTNEFGVLTSPSSPPSTSPLSASTSSSTTGIARPKPRTGTGMVYRTSSSVGMNSKMRAPMVLSSSVGGSAKSGPATNGSGIVSSSSTSAANTGSIGRSGGIPRAIIL